ncbi:MAG: NADH-quinone oxidoreductase subunit N [Alphaproteobacteria bacterium]
MTELPIILPALPEIFLAIAGMALMMVGVFISKKRAPGVVSVLAMVMLALTVVLTVFMNKGDALAFNGLFVTDQFAVFMKVLVLLGSIVALLMSDGFIQRERMNRFEYPILVIFATLGMMMMISANDLISLYIGLELQSLSLYVLAAFQRDNLRSTEAGLKYFVLGALSSGMLLYGCSLIYGFTGSTSFTVLSTELSVHGAGSVGLVVGIVFLCAGLAFKISAVPFHMWTPDVYEGAPTPVTAFGGLVDEWRQVIIAISAASMVLGAFAAIAQKNIKRLMAYSSIGHVGYALVGLAAGSEIGVRGILLYMTIYMIMTLGTFACILCMRRNGVMVEEIDDLSGLSQTHPRIALALLVFMFSLAGVPPMAGFFGKLYIFLAAIEAELYTLAILGVLASVVGAFYYLRIIKIMYFDDAREVFDTPIGKPLSSVMTVTAIATALFFVVLTPVLNEATLAAAALFPG